MSLTTDSISNVNYLYPVPTLATAESINANTLKGIADKYKDQFEAHEKIQNQIFNNFRSILDLQENDYKTIDSLGTSEFYRDTKTINGKKIDKNCCVEGYLSYRFYIKEIVTKLQNIEKYLNEVKEIFQNLNDLKGTDEQISNQAHALIDRLSILDKFIYENIQDFQEYFIYNNDIKQWEQIYTNITASSIPSQLSNYNQYETLEALRKTQIAYIDSSLNNPKADISSFNSLTLLDKLKFIRYYYKLILEKDVSFHIFPSDVETGYPCLPNVESKEKTKATQELGSLELFYIGYLIDRDGPINAVSSFFEVKTSALRSNIALMSEKISALNEYLSFINCAMDLLNQSQSNASNDKKNRIPDGAWIALTYICGQDMYNLFEYKDKKYLVIPYQGDYLLVEASKAGMLFLLGDKVEHIEWQDSDKDISNSNGCLYVDLEDKRLFFYNQFDVSGSSVKPVNKNTPEYLATTTTTTIDGKETKCNIGYYGEYKKYNNWEQAMVKTVKISDFKLPTQLEVQTIIPGSVSKYNSFSDRNAITTEVVNSWTTAFSNKTQYINTAIDTINTDVTLDRSKIDTFDSLCSTFRNKAHEAYSNTASNIR